MAISENGIDWTMNDAGAMLAMKKVYGPSKTRALSDHSEEAACSGIGRSLAGFLVLQDKLECCLRLLA